jgi:hypothetical protein
MVSHCLNCGAELHGAYCRQCGQKANVERITLRYVLQEVFRFFTHIESGFLYTSIQMLRAPGITTKNFIEGKRKSYQTPVSYFLIWITVYMLTLYLFEAIFGENVVIDYKNYFGPDEATREAIAHLSLVLIIVIPFQALYLWLLMTRKVYGYFESMVAIIYSLGTIILLQFLFAVLALITYLAFGVSVDLILSDVLKVFFIFWFVVDFIRPLPLTGKAWRVLLFALFAFGTFTVWRLYGYPAIAAWIY